MKIDVLPFESLTDAFRFEISIYKGVGRLIANSDLGIVKARIDFATAQTMLDIAAGICEGADLAARQGVEYGQYYLIDQARWISEYPTPGKAYYSIHTKRQKDQPRDVAALRYSPAEIEAKETVIFFDLLEDATTVAKAMNEVAA